MIDTISRLKHKIGDKDFTFHCEGSSTWGEVHTALTHMMGFAVQKINEAYEAAKPKEEKKDEQASS